MTALVRPEILNIESLWDSVSDAIQEMQATHTVSLEESPKALLCASTVESKLQAQEAKIAELEEQLSVAADWKNLETKVLDLSNSLDHLRAKVYGLELRVTEGPNEVGEGCSRWLDEHVKDIQDLQFQASDLLQELQVQHRMLGTQVVHGPVQGSDAHGGNNEYHTPSIPEYSNVELAEIFAPPETPRLHDTAQWRRQSLPSSLKAFHRSTPKNSCTHPAPWQSRDLVPSPVPDRSHSFDLESAEKMAIHGFAVTGAATIGKAKKLVKTFGMDHRSSCPALGDSKEEERTAGWESTSLSDLDALSARFQDNTVMDRDTMA